MIDIVNADGCRVWQQAGFLPPSLADALCVMEGAKQQLYHHCITKDARVKTPRVSVTFRRLV